MSPLLRKHSAPDSSPSPRAPRFIGLFVTLALLTAALLPQGMTAPRIETAPDSYLTVPVRRSNLDVTLSQRGLIDSAKNIVVSSECEWTARIIELIPEGTWVEEGDVVVRLDSSELEERLKKNEIDLIDAEADLIQAKEVLSMQELENESGLAKAQLALTLARLDLQKYEQGEFPKERKEAEAAVALAEEDVTRSRERAEYVARLVRKGYESPVSLENERISLHRYENKLANAQRALDVLLNHTQHREMTALSGAVVEAEQTLERVEKISKIAIINRQVQRHTRQKKRDAAVEVVERLRKSIAACTIRSPKTGEIIYANEGSRRDEIIEGEYVRNRQEVVRIPDLSRMDVKLRIHESLIEGVKTGLRASIRVDAYPDLQLTGRVNSVSRVPTTGRSYNSDLKEYDATVRIDTGSAPAEFLKPGLTAQVSVLIDRQPDCIQIPVQTIVKVGGQSIVFVDTPTGLEHRVVEIGMTSDTAAEVVSGLDESDRVLLSPRSTCSEQIIALRESFSSETNVANIGG